MTHFQNQLGQNHLYQDATMLKQDAQLLRSNEVLGGQQLLTGGLANQGATIIEKDIKIVEQNFGGAQPMQQFQGSPRLLQGSPRLVQGSPRLVQLQGSPTGLMQGSPMRQVGFNQSLGGYAGQSLATTTTTTSSCQGAPLLQGQNISCGQAQFGQGQFVQGKQFFNQEVLMGQNFSQGETIVERIVEAPIVVTH